MQKKYEESLPYSAGAVVNGILTQAKNQNRSLTQMELYKRLYFVYGVYLAETGDKLFNEQVEAWVFGPVVEKIYHSFKHFGKKFINEKYFDMGDSEEEKIVPVVEGNEKLIKIIDIIAEVYENADGKDLSIITHRKGSPWDTFWDEQRRNMPISDESIKTYFKEKMIPDIHDMLEFNKVIGTVNNTYGTNLAEKSQPLSFPW